MTVGRYPKVGGRQEQSPSPSQLGHKDGNATRFMKRLFIFTFCLLLFEVGDALDVPDFMMVPKSTWVAGFPELNKADIQTEIATAPRIPTSVFVWFT